jgi:hypothetical protein
MLLQSPTSADRNTGIFFAGAIKKMDALAQALGNIVPINGGAGLGHSEQLRHLPDARHNLYLSETYHSGSGRTLEIRVLMVSTSGPADPGVLRECQRRRSLTP